MKVFLSHSLKNLFSPFLAFLLSLCEYKDMVHVDNESSFSNHISEGGVHEGLEHGRGVTLSKEHYQGFIEAIRSDKCCLPFISLFDLNVVVSPSDVHF